MASPAGSEAEFAGHAVRGGPPRATLIVSDTLDDGRQWRLLVGNAQAAVQIARTGTLTTPVDGRGNCCEPPVLVTHVVNAAAAEVPCCFLNGRSGVLYANVVTLDWPAPRPEDDAQRPDWRAALELLDASRRLAPGGAPGQPVTVVVHCVYGLNRSVTTAALMLRAAYPGHLPSLDAALAYIASRQRCEVMPVYQHWARAALAAIGLTCCAAPAAAAPVAETPPAPPAPVSAAARRREKGAGVLLLHDFYDDAAGRFLGLCALLVRDHSGGFCAPLEGAHPGESPAETAARALHEEAHLPGWAPGTLAEDAHFACVDVPRCPVVFIARLRGAAHVPHGCPPGTALSRRAFAAARAQLLAQHAAGARYVHGAPLADFLETTELAHARVEDLLAIGEHAAAACAGQAPSAAAPALRDHRKRVLSPLRPVLVSPILQQPGVREVLRAELQAYAARHPSPQG